MTIKKAKVKPRVKSKTVKTKERKMAEKEEPKEKSTKELLKDFKFKPYYKESYTVSPRIGEDETGAVPGWLWDKPLPESSFVRVCKTKNKTIENLRRDYFDSECPFQKDAVKFFEENWDQIQPYQIGDVFKLTNIEHRRLLFNIFGAENIWDFIKKDSELIKSETVKRDNKRWTADLKEYNEKLEDIYELYKIPLTSMFPEFKNQQRRNEFMYMVKMSCPSTDKMHMIYVPNEVGQKGDPIESIAWTEMVNITNPGKMYRQGDIFIIEHNKDSVKCEPRHLTKKEYLSAELVSQT